MYFSIKAFNKESFIKFHNIYGNTTRKSSDIIYDVFKIDYVEITYYKNLTILFKGALTEKIKQDLVILIDTNLYVGSDEVGIGENFGPLVVCGLKFKSFEDKVKAIQLGIKDSKKLTHGDIMRISKEILLYANASCKILTPEKFNSTYKKVPNTKKINALLHNEVHLELKQDNYQSVIDQFVSKSIFNNYLEGSSNKITKYLSETKAEDKYLEVAGAAIVAKSLFNNWVIDYCEKESIEYELKDRLNIQKLWSEIKSKKVIIKEPNKFIKDWTK